MSTNFSRPISLPPSRTSSSYIPLQPPPQPSYARRPSRSESHTSLLSRVLEDEQDESCCVKISRRSPCPSSGSASMSRASTLEELGEWVVDIMAVQGGRTRWLERERVILILGDVPAGALEPLTSNSSFAHTLILTRNPPQSGPSYPSIQALSYTDLEDAIYEATTISAAYRKKNKKKYRANHATSSSNPSPFDAIIHFLPPPIQFDPSMALQRMLRETIMATTVATATLASFAHDPRPSKSKGNDHVSDMPIPLIHIIPPGSPGALPIVIERYLLQLLPSLSAASRPIRPLVLSSSAWSTRQIPFAAQIPTVDTVIFGGLEPSPGMIKVNLSSWDRVSSSVALLPPIDPSTSWSRDIAMMDRRDSSTSTSSTSQSSFGPHEAITPLSASSVDVNNTVRHGTFRSRLSFVETMSDGMEREKQPQAEMRSAKSEKSVFGWMRRKASA